MPSPRRHRRARILASAALGVAVTVAVAGCSGTDAGRSASDATTATTAPPTIDPAIKTHEIAWTSDLPTGRAVITRALTAANAPTRPVRLGDKGKTVEKLSWSPDGSTLLYDSDVSGNFEIYRLSAGGDTPINLTNDPGSDGWPVWSPDGRTILFFSNRGAESKQFNAWVMDADGRNPRQLTRGTKPVTWLSWSPDGTKVLYVETDGLLSRIYQVAADGTAAPQPLAVENGTQTSPHYSPDGRTVAYTSQVAGDPVTHIFLMDPDGANKRKLTDGPTADHEPMFSPDGRRVAFLRAVEGENGGSDDDVFVRDLTTGAELDVSHVDGATARQYSWSPDGRFIMFTTNRAGDDEIIVVNADGSAGIVASGNPKAPDTFGSWRPRTAGATTGTTATP